MPHYDSVAIIGVGLLGGSIGLALRERGLAGNVVGVGRSMSSLQRALDRAAITQATTDHAEGVAGADLVVVATPVETIADQVKRVAQACPRGALITDVGSTKGAIVSELEGDATCDGYVGSHPLAGDHRSGPEYARSDLLIDRVVVVTPSSATDPDVATRVGEFWSQLGARVVTMRPDEHDAVLAVTSHLPHLVAAALAQVTDESLRPFVASGWRDTTRIAAADARLWRQIFAQNRVATLSALDRFQVAVAQLREALDAGDDDRVEKYLQEARQRRDALGS